MLDLIDWTEDDRTTTPSAPVGLSAAAAALDPVAVFDRLEQWTGYRWGVRNFTAVITGPGCWNAPVGPATYTDVEAWVSDHWELGEIRPAPVGLEFSGGTFRVSGTVGTVNEPAESVMEAWRRYAEYIAQNQKNPGLSRYSRTIGDYSLSWTRDRNALAKAMAGSGAADLLRKYRKVRA